KPADCIDSLTLQQSLTLISIMTRLSFATPSVCSSLLPSLPPTVRDLDVPPLFRRRFVLGGYRPVGQPWRLYLQSLFQMHNDALTVWSPLLAAVVIALRFMMFTGLSVDVSSLPLVFYMFFTLTYLTAHLLKLHSERAHYLLFLLNNVGGAMYLYCCTSALYLYSTDYTWTQSMLGKIFLPAAAFLCWTSCCVSCHVEVRSFWTSRFHRRLYSLTMITATGPVAHRLTSNSWAGSPAASLHLLQMVLSLFAAFFFSCSSPECLSPGSFDLLGHSQQLFHVLLSLCVMVQQEALFCDFLWRRPALSRLFGEEHLLLVCNSFCWLTFCCGVTAWIVLKLKRLF
uniref:Progestin and adipoQ receptor family member VIII n=1 Tax=Cyprinodon variegatus TaxID=28743 RepID=A0A3Q2GP96_CYPVA